MKFVHSVHFCGRPQDQPSSERGPQFLFDRPARDLPTHPFKCFPLGQADKGSGTSLFSSLTGAMNWYPRLGTVSMKTGLS